MRYAFILTLTSMMAAATAAHAASETPANLSDVSGAVFVNVGDGFVRASANQPVSLKPGDKILVRDNSFATVTFAECAVAISKPTLYVVSSKNPCTKSAELPEQSLVVTPTATSDDSEVRAMTMIVSGAVVLGAGAALIDALTDNSSSN